MKVTKNATVVLSHGNQKKEFVVLGFTKSHVSLAKKSDYDHSMKTYGEYRRMAYGYTSWNLKSSGVQLGFWKLLESVDGKQVA